MVSQSQVSVVWRYVQDQMVHHRERTFEDEFLALLQQHGITIHDTCLKPSITGNRAVVPSGLAILIRRQPQVETWGYLPMSLRDESSERFPK